MGIRKQVQCCCRFQGLILSGSYTDFSPAWYKDVGFTITLVAFLNLIMPGMILVP